MNPAHRQLVRQSNLFHAATESTLERAMQLGSIVSVTREGYFFMQEDPAEHAYVLLEGRVKMLQVTPGGQQITLRIMTPGQTYGGIALLRPEKGYPASALAVEDSLAMSWSTADMRALAATDPAVPLNTMQIMHAYIQDLQERNAGLISERAEQRIARALLKLAGQSGRHVEGESVLIDMRLSRQDVAEMSGTTLFTVSRTLAEWEREGWLKIGRERVEITNPHALVRLADGN